ncbi:MAG: lytic murein transglycosylase [Methyloceanibacter sp.]
MCGAGSALLVALAFPEAAHADKFQTCVQSLWPAAKAGGVSRETFDRAFQGAAFDAEVIELATYQPEYVKPIGEYIDRAASEKRIVNGKQKLIEYKPLLDQLEAKYGVDRHILVAIWGVESNYGDQPGDKNVINSLATLICSNTKAKFARGQIVSALKILQRGDVTYENMNGSWAGAMGHTQFIPTTYSAYAVDYDGDGRRDIWGTIPDALGSTASYLRVSKWQPGQTWGYEVRVPKGVNPSKIGESTSKSLGQWEKLGFVRASGQPFPRPGDKATLFAPEGANGPAFLVLNNFRSLLRYNVAKSYALAVGHLADRLAGGGPFIQQWPVGENRLSLDQRKELQTHLIAHGHLEGEVDGIVGKGTGEGIKSYQRAKGLKADGIPTQTLLKTLRSEVPPPAPIPVEQPVGAVPEVPGQPAVQAVPAPVQQPADGGQQAPAAN